MELRLKWCQPRLILNFLCFSTNVKKINFFGKCTCMFYFLKSPITTSCSRGNLYFLVTYGYIMHVKGMTFERNSSLGVTPCGFEIG